MSEYRWRKEPPRFREVPDHKVSHWRSRDRHGRLAFHDVTVDSAGRVIVDFSFEATPENFPGYEWAGPVPEPLDTRRSTGERS